MSCLYYCDIDVAASKVIKVPKQELVTRWDDNAEGGYGGWVTQWENVYPPEFEEIRVFQFFEPTATDDGFREGNWSEKARNLKCFSGLRCHVPAKGVYAYD